MPYVFVKELNATRALVEAVYQDDEISADLKTKGIYINEVPTPESHSDLQTVMYYNPTTGAVHYEYEAIQPAVESALQLKIRLQQTEGNLQATQQKLEEAEMRLASTEEALFQIMFGGM